jgi:hypothetical protein
MALIWTQHYVAMVGWQGQSMMVLAKSDWYAQSGNREYFINRDEQDDQKCNLDVFVAGHPSGIAQFDSAQDAKDHAEQRDRSARYAEACHYARLKEGDLAVQKGFGAAWADKYSAEGLARRSSLAGLQRPMTTTAWTPTDEPCDMCGQAIYTRSYSSASAQSVWPTRVIWETRCLNGECLKGRLPQ